MRLFSAILFALIIVVMVFLDSLISNLAFQSVSCETKSNRGRGELQVIETVHPVVLLESYLVADDKVTDSDRVNIGDPKVEHTLNPSRKRLRKFNMFRSTQKWELLMGCCPMENLTCLACSQVKGNMDRSYICSSCIHDIGRHDGNGI